MAEIILKNIMKRFGDLIAVNNLNLDVKDKEFLVLLGPSGCGKTTTLRCISGLDMPEEGEILLDGRDVTTTRASYRDIAFVFQLYALYPILSAYENIAFPLKAQKVGKEKVKEEVNKVAKLLKIEHILNKRPRELSGGDMQKVALGRAIVRRPKAFLLDEPIGTLDAKFREEMRYELKKLHIDIGATTVYVTHDQVEAMSMGDRIAVMSLGVLQQVGTPHDIYSNPKNLFVANFIGSPGMNFIDCKVQRNPDGKLVLRLLTDDGCVTIPDRIKNVILRKNYEDKGLVVGIRPEDISLSMSKKEDYLNAEIFVIEEMGSYNIVDVIIGKDKIRVRTLPDVKPGIREKAFINFDTDRISVFDKETGNSVLNGE